MKLLFGKYDLILRAQGVGSGIHQELPEKLLRGRIEDHRKWPADPEGIQSPPSCAIL